MQGRPEALYGEIRCALPASVSTIEGERLSSSTGTAPLRGSVVPVDARAALEGDGPLAQRGRAPDRLVAAVTDSAVQEKLLAAGIEPESSTSEALKAFVGAEIKKWAEIVKAAGIQPE